MALPRTSEGVQRVSYDMAYSGKKQMVAIAFKVHVYLRLPSTRRFLSVVSFLVNSLLRGKTETAGLENSNALGCTL